MNIAMISQDGDPRPVREAVPGEGWIWRSSLALIRANGWPIPEGIDVVMTMSFNLDEEPASAALLRNHLSDDVPVVRIDPA